MGRQGEPPRRGRPLVRPGRIPAAEELQLVRLLSATRALSGERRAGITQTWRDSRGTLFIPLGLFQLASSTRHTRFLALSAPPTDTRVPHPLSSYLLPHPC